MLFEYRTFNKTSLRVVVDSISLVFLTIFVQVFLDLKLLKFCSNVVQFDSYKQSVILDMFLCEQIVLSVERLK
jgi:hypothetical protein